GEAASIVPLAPPTLPIVASLQQHLAVPGVAAPDNPTYAGSRAHAPNEHIRLEDLQPALRFTYALLRDLGARGVAAPAVRNSRTKFKDEPGSVPRRELGARPREPGSRVSSCRALSRRRAARPSR